MLNRLYNTILSSLGQLDRDFGVDVHFSWK